MVDVPGGGGEAISEELERKSQLVNKLRELAGKLAQLQSWHVREAAGEAAASSSV